MENNNNNNSGSGGAPDYDGLKALLRANHAKLFAKGGVPAEEHARLVKERQELKAALAAAGQRLVGEMGVEGREKVAEAEKIKAMVLLGIKDGELVRQYLELPGFDATNPKVKAVMEVLLWLFGGAHPGILGFLRRTNVLTEAIRKNSPDPFIIVCAALAKRGEPEADAVLAGKMASLASDEAVPAPVREAALEILGKAFTEPK